MDDILPPLPGHPLKMPFGWGEGGERGGEEDETAAAAAYAASLSQTASVLPTEPHEQQEQQEGGAGPPQPPSSRVPSPPEAFAPAAQSIPAGLHEKPPLPAIESGNVDGGDATGDTAPAGGVMVGGSAWKVEQAVAKAVAERTELLTKIYQRKLREQVELLDHRRESDAKDHAVELRLLQKSFEDRLTAAAAKVRQIHETNRDAVGILRANKKLVSENARLGRELVGAAEAQREAEARERARADEGSAVVAQLMRQLQEKESLLASGAGGLSAEEREAMVEKERRRLEAQEAERLKAIEAAAAAERAKVYEKMGKVTAELEASRRELAGRGEMYDEVCRELAEERGAHKLSAAELVELRAIRAAEAEKAAALVTMEREVTRARSAVGVALRRIRSFLDETQEHITVDHACHACLGPLTDAQMCVPCGHSLCSGCATELERLAAEQPEYGHAKFCPVCTGGLGGAHRDATPVESFPNTMLDAVLARLREKEQDVHTLLNFVEGIGHFEVQGAGALAPTGVAQAGSDDEDAAPGAAD